MVVALAGVAASHAWPAAARPSFVVVATNLNNPRKIFVGAGGALYVVEAGIGGYDTCLPPLSDPTCVGLTGSVTRVAGHVQRRVVTGLVSIAGISHQRAQGASDVLVAGGVYYVLLQDTTIDARGRNALGPDGATAGDLIATAPGRAAPRVIADLASYEAAHNPDRGAGPGARFGNPPIDSDPYAFVRYRGGFAVADAAANDLLWVDPKGRVTTLAVFPLQTERLDEATADKLGAPRGMTWIKVQSVPTSVAVGPDGALYVGELTGVPFKPGRARVWRVLPGKKPTVYASGFTTISDLAFDHRDLLVLEITTRGLLDSSSPGALIRLSPSGKRTVVASAGLVAPTGLAVGNNSIYISNYGLFPGGGGGPRGQLVRLPA